MPYRILVFTPDEQPEFETAANGQKFESALSDFANLMREKVKYGSEEDQATTWQDVRTLFYETLSEAGVEL